MSEILIPRDDFKGRVALVEDGDEDVHALPPRARTMPLLVEVHAVVRDAERLGELVRLGRHQHGSERAADEKSLALFGQGRRGDLHQASRAGVGRTREQAELVAAQPESPA